MKKQLIGFSILALSLALVFLVMSCAPTQNTNQPLNANTNANSNTEATLTDCSENGINTEVNKIIKNSGIENQHTGSGNQYGTINLKFKPIQMGTEWVLLIEGGISDGKKDKPSSNSEFMETFIKNVDQIITKTCVSRATFVNPGTIEKVEKGSLGIGDIPGFDWSTCDWPNVACPNGGCYERCPGKTNPSSTPRTESNTNSNTSVNSNRNGNTSANGNANRTP